MLHHTLKARQTCVRRVFDQRQPAAMHCNAGRRALKKVTPILGGFSREDYVTERLWATAPDGVTVPITIA